MNPTVFGLMGTLSWLCWSFIMVFSDFSILSIWQLFHSLTFIKHPLYSESLHWAVLEALLLAVPLLSQSLQSMDPSDLSPSCLVYLYLGDVSVGLPYAWSLGEPCQWWPRASPCEWWCGSVWLLSWQRGMVACGGACDRGGGRCSDMLWLPSPLQFSGVGSLFPNKDVPRRGRFLVSHPFFSLLGHREPCVYSSASVLLPLEPSWLPHGIRSTSLWIWGEMNNWFSCFLGWVGILSMSRRKGNIGSLKFY